MALRPLADVSPGDWFLDRGDHRTRASLGPSGFEAYVRVLHGDEPQPHEGDLSRIEGHLDDPLLAALCDVLSRHTTTPQDCYFGLWDGYGAIQGGEAVGFLTTFAVAPLWPSRIFGREEPRPLPPPAFPPEVMNGPRLHAGRDHLLFAGPLSRAGQWGAANYAVDLPRGGINSPNLMWPADRSWFVTTNIDSAWTGVGGSARLIADILADGRLEAVRTTYTDNQPEYL